MLCEIYSYYVINTNSSFEHEAPEYSVFKNRIININENYPYLVCEYEDKVIGYAYATRQAERKSYDYNASLSIYFHKDYTNRGFGRILYNRILNELRDMGVYNAYAVVTWPNEASEKFHLSMDFEKVAVFPNIGYKFHEWIGTTWFLKTLISFDTEPTPLKKYERKELF